jgi:beta-phosphoglucomutase
VRPARAIVFDFNGTLSDDEPILCEIFVELFAEHGKPLSAQEYFDSLAGHADDEIVMRWLGRDHRDVPAVVAERIARYRAALSDGSSVHAPVRDAVRYAAERVPLGVVTGATRSEVEPVLEAAGLTECFCTVITADDVMEGKPHPEGYLKALGHLKIPDAADVVVFEDTEAGVASAKAAGMRCFAKRGTLDPHRLVWADELVDAIDVELMQRVLA